MRIAFVGTRGVPARYGGFETAIEEVGSRLAKRGHTVVVYCRGEGDHPATYKGMKLRWVRAARKRSLETLSHTILSALHLRCFERVDMVFAFNAANVPALGLLRMSGPVALHMDGLESQRSKWGPTGRRYYLAMERIASKTKLRLIADAQGIADYYQRTYDRETVLIAYGANKPVAHHGALVAQLNLTKASYDLVVARFEQENHVLDIVRAFRASESTQELIVVGSAPYSDKYIADIEEAAAGDSRIRLVGAVWDQDLLDDLYASCRLYIHGHSVGGTNPSLLRAMASGSAVAAFDVVFNREVTGDKAAYWSQVGDLTALIHLADNRDLNVDEQSKQLLDYVEEHYNWDAVADAYEQLAFDVTRRR